MVPCSARTLAFQLFGRLVLGETHSPAFTLSPFCEHTSSPELCRAGDVCGETPSDCSKAAQHPEDAVHGWYLWPQGNRCGSERYEPFLRLQPVLPTAKKGKEQNDCTSGEEKG